MRLYETVFIISPDLGEEEVKEWVERILGIISTKKGEIVSVENWGKKRLAYEVKRQRYGTYILIHFRADREALNEVERIYKMSEAIIKYLIIRINEKQLAYLTKIQRPTAGEEFGEESEEEI